MFWWVWVGIVCAGGATSFSLLRGGDCGCLYRGSWLRQKGVSWVGLGWGGGWIWLERFRFRCLSRRRFSGVDGLGWSVLVGSCVGCLCDNRGRMGMVVVWCGRMCVMWEAGVVVRVDQREVYE